jgi:hypothetical protein
MANEQSVFTFDSNVMRDQFNELTDPIIQVITENNSFAWDRESLMGQRAGDPLKIRLIDGDPILTYQTILPYLQQTGLETNFRGIMTVNEAVLNEISRLRDDLSLTLFIGATLILTALALAVQNTIIFFNRNSQKFVVQRVFGVGFIRAYQNFFHYFIGIWGVQIVLLLGMTLIFDLEMSLALCLLLMGLEGIISILMISHLEKKNKMHILKGEN